MPSRPWASATSRLPDRPAITDTTSGLYGGTAKFDYRLAPFGKKDVPTRAVWDVAYRDVHLAMLTDFLQTPGLRLDGRATGRVVRHGRRNPAGFAITSAIARV